MRRDSPWHKTATLLINISLVLTWETFWWRETNALIRHLIHMQETMPTKSWLVIEKLH